MTAPLMPTTVIVENCLVERPGRVVDADEGVELPASGLQQRKLRVEVDEQCVALVAAYCHRHIKRGAHHPRERVLEEQAPLGAAVAADVAALQAQHLLVPSGQGRQRGGYTYYYKENCFREFWLHCMNYVG